MHYVTDEHYKIAEENGIHKNLVYQRVYICGWDTKRAITQPVRQGRKKSRIKQLHEEALANGIDITFAGIGSRMNKGWSRKEIVTIPRGQRPGGNWNSEYKKFEKMAVGNGIPVSTYQSRVQKYGWPMRKAASMSVKREKDIERRVARLHRKQIG